jgi:thioredoxin
MGGGAEAVKSKEEFDKIKASGKVAIDFTATWCGPCQRIGPVFAKMSEDYPDIKFIKIDVDEAEDLSELYQVEAMPTFVFLKGGEDDGACFEKMVGASEDKLKEALDKLKAAS